MTARFWVDVLGAEQERDGFTCGVKALDRYFAQQATQDVRRRAVACCAEVEISSKKVACYYTLAAGDVPLTSLPQALTKWLPRYPSVPVARIGRLAVDRAFHGQQLGGALLADAALRALPCEVAVFALVVDAKDACAEAFYRHHGFERFGAISIQLIVSLKHFSSSADLAK